MLITTSFETLTATMARVSAVVSDKMLKDDLKNIIFWVKDGVVRLGAFGGIVATVSETDATCSETQGEYFFQLRAKEVQDTLTTFTGLKRTQVSKIEFYIQQNEAQMLVYEEAIDDEMDNAQGYSQRSRFRISKPILKDNIRMEIEKVIENTDGVTVETGDLLLFVSSLYPTIAKETREASYNMMFSDTHVYTVPSQYAAIMVNKLPDVFRDFRLSNSMVNFLKNFIGNEETFTIGKQVLQGGLVILTVTVGNSTATIKCPDMSRAFDITNFLEIPETGVAVDKLYLKDVLKRISLGNEPANVSINIAGGYGDVVVATKAMTQRVPTIASKGEGEFAFQIRADLLSNLIFSHAEFLGDSVFLYLLSDNNRITLCATDNLKLWHTKIASLSPSKGDFNWQE